MDQLSLLFEEVSIVSVVTLHPREHPTGEWQGDDNLNVPLSLHAVLPLSDIYLFPDSFVILLICSYHHVTSLTYCLHRSLELLSLPSQNSRTLHFLVDVLKLLGK